MHNLTKCLFLPCASRPLDEPRLPHKFKKKVAEILANFPTNYLQLSKNNVLKTVKNMLKESTGDELAKITELQKGSASAPPIFKIR